MNLQIVAEHTIDVDLVSICGHVLDAGCRDFHFSRVLASLGARVVAVDADPEVSDPDIDGVRFERAVIDTDSGVRRFVVATEPQARHVVRSAAEDGVDVRAVTIQSLMQTHDVPIWDAVKLDVEGSEYAILRAWPGPIAKQISIEFHEHCVPQPPDVYDAIFNHLDQWYRVVQHVKERRHCAAPNYWDTLFVLK